MAGPDPGEGARRGAPRAEGKNNVSIRSVLLLKANILNAGRLIVLGKTLLSIE